MRARLHHSLADFRTVAGTVYARDAVLANTELSLLQGEHPRAAGAAGDAPLMVTVADGAPVGAAIQTPPFPLLCTGLGLVTEDAIAVGAREVARLRPGLESVRGICSTVNAFSAAWQQLTGRSGALGMAERLYRLGTLTEPVGVPGVSRRAADEDADLVAAWWQAFHTAAFGTAAPTPTTTDPVLLWLNGAEPVSLAVVRAPAAGVSRIGPVYTPPDRRGRGYGSAVTAAAARWALQRSATEVVLYTDLANPVSNAIYQRIGFEPVADWARIDFAAVR